VLTAVERILILRGTDLLKDIGPPQLRRLAEVTREVEWWKGDTIYKEDELADALYMVVEGRFRLTIGERVTSEVGPGEAFGTWALVDESRRGHRVECIEDGLALVLSRDDFDDVAAGDLTLLRQVVRALTGRLRSLVSERPDEARIEGEGVEKPEALDESKSNVLEIETSTSSSKAAESPPPAESPASATHDLALPRNGEAHVGDATEPE
jgi:CRP-like cAMP-binding protein